MCNLRLFLVLQEVEAWYLRLVESVREGKLSKVTELLDPPAPGLLRRIEPLSQMILLMLAASKGHVDIARLLVRSGAKVDQRNFKGRTALMEACIAGHNEMVVLLVDEGADIAMQDSKGRDAIRLACHHGHCTIVTQLWRGIISSHRPCRTLGEKLLACAYALGRLEIVQMLVYDGMVLHPHKTVRHWSGYGSTVEELKCKDFIQVSARTFELPATPASTVSLQAVCPSDNLSLSGRSRV